MDSVATPQPILYSFSWEKDKWSWGNIVKPLLVRLGNNFRVTSIDYAHYGGGPMQFLEKEDSYILGQNAGQLQKLAQYERTVCRLGGFRTFRNNSSLKNKLILQRLSQCFAIVATNRKLQAIAETVNKNVHLIPNGLDLQEWEVLKKSFRKDLVVGFVGNIKTKNKREYKGFDILQQTCGALKLKLKTALYGDDKIPHDQMRERFYSEIDVLVLLTDGEGCSNTIMEALACGIPVITTKDAGYHGEELTHGDNVLFCKKNNRDLKLSLQKLQRSSFLYYKLAKNSRKFAEIHHDIDKIAERYRAIFLSCVEKFNDYTSETKQEVVTPLIKSQRFNKRRQAVSIETKEISTIVCVLRSGGDYGPEDVYKLKSMLSRNITQPYLFSCLTNMSNICDGVPLINEFSGWWSKIELFRKGLFTSSRMLYFDLDTIILKNIDDLFKIDFQFAALRPWNPRNRRRRYFASGMMAWKNGEYDFIYDEFSPDKIALNPVGDQQYMSRALMAHGGTYRPLQESVSGIYSYKRDCRQVLPSDARIVCFHGHPHPSDLPEVEWVKEHYR